MYARTCHEAALPHGVCSASAPTGIVQDMVGEAANTSCKDIRIGIRASALTRCRLGQPSQGLHAYGWPHAPAHDTLGRWVADVRYPSARHTAGALQSGRCILLFDFADAAVAFACRLCQDHVFRRGTDFGSARSVQAPREHR